MFHDSVPDQFIFDIFRMMNDNPKHTFQFLTKRPERMARLATQVNWSDNIWAGCTVEGDAYIDRIGVLRNIPAKIKFLSCEPLLTSLSDADFTGIDWVLVQGESGSRAREIKKEWIFEIKEKCKKLNIPFFFFLRLGVMD